ncbi:Nuclear GTPase SLIP-GC [Paramyrothecium foliicola]|nr:Nuclear GTPase SLIP-GC [Paramyrothecium foliicola]
MTQVTRHSHTVNFNGAAMSATASSAQERLSSTGAARSARDASYIAETLLPSTEEGATPLTGGPQLATATSPLRTPSMSLTPPESSSSPTATPRASTGTSSYAGHSERDIGSIDAQLQATRLYSPLHMTDVAEALEKSVEDVGGRERSLLSPEPSQASSTAPSPGRRRSSSRVKESMHDVNDEQPPNDRFHEPIFQANFRDAKTLMMNLSSTLGSNAMRNEPDSIMQHLYTRATDLGNFQCPSTRTVGFVGDSGVGKSSLLNSLLDRRGLARTSNSGSACTCVVTEYQYHESSDYKVEINFFTIQELSNQVSSLLQEYRHYHLHRDDFTREEVSAREEAKNNAKVAIDTFQAMFARHLLSERVLLGSSESEALAILEGLLRECQPADRERVEWQRSLEECSELIGRLTSESSSEQSTTEPALWPYIRSITVYSNAHILSRGLILVDLPGLHDANAARRHITERYVIKCNEIFAICNEGRAITDAGVVSVLELAKKARLGNVGIICTRSDDIKADEARRDWKGDTAIEVESKINAVRQSKENIREIQSELEGYETDYEDLTVEEQLEQNRLTHTKNVAETELKRLKFELDNFLITTRNNIVKRQLLEKYGTQVSSGRLHVHCVSNVIYWEHRNKPKSQAMPYLTLCGILEIREHCMSLVSESRYHAAEHYMKNDIPALLGDTKLWVQSGSGSMSAEKKTKIRETLSFVEIRLKQELCGHGSELKGLARSLKQRFNETIYSPNRDQILAWCEAATEASGDWTTWHHSSYSAFCSNRGSHTTSKIGKRDWNEEIIESMVNDLSPMWVELCSAFEEQNEHLTNTATELIDWAVDYLDTELQDESEVTEVLSQTLLYRQQLLESEFEVAMSTFMRILDSLQTDAFSGIRTSFIGTEMEQHYRKANSHGSDARRKATINSAVQQRQLFKDLLKKFKRVFDLHADDFQQSISQVAQSQLAGIRLTLNLVRDDNVVLESERDPDFRIRVETEVNLVETEMRRIRASLSMVA